MPNWIVTTGTATGDPIQCFDANGEEVFVLILTRVGGGSDERTPRRVVGTGATRGHAHAAAHASMSRYDNMGRVVSSR